MEIKKFDVLIKKDNKTIVQKLIRFFTKEQYTHSMLVLDENHIVEALFPEGVKINHINFNLGEFDAYRYVGEISKEQEKKIQEFIQRTLNTKYDVKELLMQIFKKEDKSKNKKYICISLVINAFKSANLPVDEFKIGFEQVTHSKYFKKIN